MRTPVDLSDSRQRVRAVLCIGILGGILTAAFFFFLRPNADITFDVFYYAAKQSMSGEVSYVTGHGLWVYTPPALLYFYPYALLFDFETALLVHRILSVPVVVFYGFVLARFISKNRDLETVDELLIIGFTSLSVYPVVNVVNGSFVGMFTATLGLGWILLEYDNDFGGVAWALASLVKGFPAFWGAYLLRVRYWRATAAAIGTGLSAVFIGIVLFGVDSYIRFFTIAGSNRVRLTKLSGGTSPDTEIMTPVRGLAQLFPNTDPTIWTPVIAVSIISLTVLIYILIPSETVNDRATLLLATIIGVMFIMPTSQDMDTYLIYAPLLVLLYAERHEIVQSLYLVGTLFISYNFGRGELRAVGDLFGENVSAVVMAIWEPILSFAHMPLYGLYFIYIGVLLSTWLRGRETGRIEALKQRLRYGTTTE